MTSHNTRGFIHLPAVYYLDSELIMPPLSGLTIKVSTMSKELFVVLGGQDCGILK